MPFRTLVFLINQLINYYNVIITCRKEGDLISHTKRIFVKKKRHLHLPPGMIGRCAPVLQLRQYFVFHYSFMRRFA